MTEELKQAAQADITERLRKDKWHITGVDAEEAAQLIEELRKQLAKAKAGERHIYEAYSRCADERNALAASQPAQTEREAFEAWATSLGYNTERDMFQRDMYQSTLTWELWRVWQARASLPTQPAAQATPDHEAEIARLKAVIDQLERREILAVAQQATPEPEWETSPKDGEQWETSPKVKAAPEPVGEAFGWWFTEDPEVFCMPGSGFRRYPNKPQHTVECIALYTRPASGVPDFATLLKVKEPDGCAADLEEANRQEARCDGWNDCRDEVLSFLAAAQAKGADK